MAHRQDSLLVYFSRAGQRAVGFIWNVCIRTVILSHRMKTDSKRREEWELSSMSRNTTSPLYAFFVRQATTTKHTLPGIFHRSKKMSLMMI